MKQQVNDEPISKLPEGLVENVKAMDRCVMALYLELPESIADDVKKHWEAVKPIILPSLNESKTENP